MTLITTKYAAAERFIKWIADRVQDDARGSNVDHLAVDPRGMYWLGRLAPETEIQNSVFGDRAERLEPCAVGIRLLPTEGGLLKVSGSANLAIWARTEGDWRKHGPIEVPFDIEIDTNRLGTTRITRVFDERISKIAPAECIKAAIDVEVIKTHGDRSEIVVTLVNLSDSDHASANDYAKARLFECMLSIADMGTDDFLLESLPDSFRYDRRVSAWGVNCGVKLLEGKFRTYDLPVFDKVRPAFWNVDDEKPDLRFSTLASNPIRSARALQNAHVRWGEDAWSLASLKKHAVDWTEQMMVEAEREREFFEKEKARISQGIVLLETNSRLRRAFCLMNEAMQISTQGKYESWRPFQIGFLLANLESCIGGDSDIVDIIWFSTGGGKTETYLGLILTAAFFDRMRGKTTGITAWSRFPLRLLSLQQTQRFANALAAAEIVRKREKIKGSHFGLGFLVGNGSTPNKISSSKQRKDRGQWDYEDQSMPNRLRMLKICPFCRKDTIKMNFNRRYWRLEHNCTNTDCDWGTGSPLPFWIVDEEVWRNLPTVIVGTLDKAAGVSMQANMRGMIAAPIGMCPEEGHGHSYSPRSGRPDGCLVPDCDAKTVELPMDANLYGMTFRLQDELHLLRDSLGAVDAHYEALLDNLQEEMSGFTPKILASSATLSGYERQSEVLYARRARVFPHPEPKIGQGFWAGNTEQKMRRYLAVAPRGQTIEYALDRMVVSLQTAIRELVDDPKKTAADLGVNEKLIPFLVDTYGTNVIYGNTLRDLDAVVRSAQTQWGEIPDPAPNVVTLTGRTVFDEVSHTLNQLELPSNEFDERVHVVAASSMMSHGVDIDRLNVMIMLGIPLATAEFIQSTARVGRLWPSLVFVVHKIARERDASIYRAFPQYVDQGDRFVEPIPITGRSRRVLERTMPGLAFARILMLHERKAKKTVWKAYGLKEYIEQHPGFKQEEAEAICGFLGYDENGTASLRADVFSWYEQFECNVGDPANSSKWANVLGPFSNGPMRSLRDVEEQVQIWGRDP